MTERSAFIAEVEKKPGSSRRPALTGEAALNYMIQQGGGA